MKQYVGTVLSVMVAGAYAAQEPKNPEKGIDKRTQQEYCIVLEIFEKLIEKLEAQHTQKWEALKAYTEKEFREYKSSRARDLTEQEAQQIIQVFKKERLKKEEKLRIKQTKERKEEVRNFVDIYYPDMNKENLETLCLV